MVLCELFIALGVILTARMADWRPPMPLMAVTLLWAVLFYPEARGIIRGLSLVHTTGHLFRAILEGIAYGSEHIFRTFRQNGYDVQDIVAAGGPTKSAQAIPNTSVIFQKPSVRQRCCSKAR